MKTPKPFSGMLSTMMRYRYLFLGLGFVVSGASGLVAHAILLDATTAALYGLFACMGVLILARGIDLAYQHGRRDENVEWTTSLMMRTRPAPSREHVEVRDVRRGVESASESG